MTPILIIFQTVCHFIVGLLALGSSGLALILAGLLPLINNEERLELNIVALCTCIILFSLEMTCMCIICCSHRAFFNERNIGEEEAMQIQQTGFQQDLTGYQPGLTGNQPGFNGYQPGLTGYDPAAVRYTPQHQGDYAMQQSFNQSQCQIIPSAPPPRKENPHVSARRERARDTRDIHLKSKGEKDLPPSYESLS